MESISEILRNEANDMIFKGYELNETAKEIKKLNVEKEYISALKESIKHEYFGRGIIYTLKKIGLI